MNIWTSIKSTKNNMHRKYQKDHLMKKENQKRENRFKADTLREKS